ncbi:MAG: signal peptidase II [Ruminiclostridium sp.]|nr:signal peptidase II [Ruminiclostridium sp.]
MLQIAIVLILVVIDRYSKYIVNKNIGYGDRISVIDNFFYLTNHDNYGAAWGVFQNGRYIFITMTVIVAIILIILMARTRSKFLKLALSVILGGAFGNLIDRVYKGGVTDFLDFYIGSYHFPTFNAADSCIVAGTILLAIYMLFIYKEPENKTEKHNNES